MEKTSSLTAGAAIRAGIPGRKSQNPGEQCFKAFGKDFSGQKVTKETVGLGSQNQDMPEDLYLADTQNSFNPKGQQ